ncbi:L-2-hydroxyglutarate oxidase [Bacteroidota bacterium]
MITTDFLIIGSGIMGLTIALELRKKFPSEKIVILEKEKELAQHASGRNSGVLHAGFYYTADSLKAKFTLEGNKQLKEFCKDHCLKLNECGKVVVAKSEEELEGLYELYERGQKNGVPVSLIDTKELLEIEPNAISHEKALYSPETATLDPTEVCEKLFDILFEKKVQFKFADGFHKKMNKNIIITTKNNVVEAKFIINTAGVYADKIAKEFGLSSNYTIIPFKGIYLKYLSNYRPVQTNVYPVPDLKNPFLGVHFTFTADHQVKMGPTAIPAFWRENYSDFKNFNFMEFANILAWDTKLFLNNSFNFRNLALQEIRKYSKNHFLYLASQLVKKLDKSHYTEWTKPGIRPQLLNTKTSELVQDFVIEKNEYSVHVLNAISPAFTSSLPFAKWIIDTFIL